MLKYFIRYVFHKNGFSKVFDLSSLFDYVGEGHMFLCGSCINLLKKMGGPRIFLQKNFQKSIPTGAIGAESKPSHHRINNYFVFLNVLVFCDVLEKWRC